jgi:hypothetical protein
MLKTELIDLANGGELWGFVGSGPSVDAGAPSWNALVGRVLGTLGDDERAAILADTRFEKGFERSEYPQSFSRIAAIVGKPALDDAIRLAMAPHQTPGELHQKIADWPLRGLITTNYDTLIEESLAQAGETGWVSVGNTDSEVTKVSGNVGKVVWHIHGCLDLPPERSDLIVTQDDYDRLYLPPESPVMGQLRGVLANARIVIIGFGFSDPEVNRTLRAVGRMCDLQRPAYAFLSGIDGYTNDEARLELLEQYNIDVVPYRVNDGSHYELTELMSIHGALILRRSLKLGQAIKFRPVYDPDTTALYTYNGSS